MKVLTKARPRKSKLSVSGAPKIRSRLSSINLLNSMFALPLTRPFIAAHQASHVLLTELNIIHSSKEKFVKSVKYAKSALQRAVSGCLYLDHSMRQMNSQYARSANSAISRNSLCSCQARRGQSSN